MQTQQSKKTFGISRMLVLLMLVGLAIWLVFATNRRTRITLYDDYAKHTLMEQEILQLIPVGSDVQHAKQVMQNDGFECAEQTAIILSCDKDNAWWPTGEGTAWRVDFHLQHGTVNGVEVWIEPTG